MSFSGLYRSTDSVKCFKLRMRLRKVTAASAFAVPRPPIAETDDDGMEMRPTEPTESVVETCVIGWQEKLFSEREADLFADKTNCISGLELKYHEDVTQLVGGRPNNRIFTYVDADRYIDPSEAQSKTTTPDTPSTYLSSNVLRWRRRRRPLRHPGDTSPSVPLNPVRVPATTESHVQLSPVHVMHVMADLSPADRLGRLEDERLLCTMQVDARGVLQIEPNFNGGPRASKYVVESEDNEVYEYVIEHASKSADVEQKMHESKMFRELYARHSDILAGVVGEDFVSAPQPDGAVRLHVRGEIVKGVDYEYDHLYVQYAVGVPTVGWSSLAGQLTGYSQISACKNVAEKRTAHWGLPFEFELVFDPSLLEGDVGDVQAQQPRIYFQVVSLDLWERYRTEGYGYVHVPHSAGAYQENVSTWRPLGHGRLSELRRFFVGGAPELDDSAYVYKSVGFDGSHLSRYGFRTETCGSLTVRMHVAAQCSNCIRSANLGHLTRSDSEETDGRKSPGKETLSAVLDAFQRAKQRMQRPF
ncbi:tectonic-like complex member MKS1 isoform X2 [Oscarella lobularis]|uniref:tectonic-like complex member MKS1 isoform X2 n=1 Tax=Oscarella lobularis TaxID=121494 RepID=UPI0033136AB3